MQPESAESTTTQPSTRRKLAICLSGLLRTYRETYQNFVDTIITPNEHEWDIDVFISTWPIEMSNNSMERMRRVAWYGEKHPLFPENLLNIADLQAKYKPVSIQVDQPIEFDVSGWYHPTSGCHIQSLMSMTYKIYACDILRRNYQTLKGFKYDAVIRARFDCVMPFPLRIHSSYNLSVLTIPSMMQAKLIPGKEWANDKFALGNADIMTIYSDWFLHFANMVKGGHPIQPETMLASHLQNHKVGFAPWGNEMEVVRPAGY